LASLAVLRGAVLGIRRVRRRPRLAPCSRDWSLRLRRLVPLAVGFCHPVLLSRWTYRRLPLLLPSLLLLGLRRPMLPCVRLRRLVLLGIRRFGRLVLPRLGLCRPVLRLL